MSLENVQVKVLKIFVSKYFFLWLRVIFFNILPGHFIVRKKINT